MSIVRCKPNQVAYADIGRPAHQIVVYAMGGLEKSTSGRGIPAHANNMVQAMPLDKPELGQRLSPRIIFLADDQR